MAITFFGVATSPADLTADATATRTVTPPASMVVGDLVEVFCTKATTALSFAVVNAGGQLWHKVGDHNNGTISSCIFWCRFNGTWSANPSFTRSGSNTTTPFSAVMKVWRPSASTKAWAVDVREVYATFTATGTTKTITGVTTTKANSVTVAEWVSTNTISWGSLSGALWTRVTGNFRNSSSGATSTTCAYCIQTGTGATGNVAQTQSGGQAGGDHIITFYETDDVVPELISANVIASAGPWTTAAPIGLAIGDVLTVHVAVFAASGSAPLSPTVAWTAGTNGSWSEIPNTLSDTAQFSIHSSVFLCKITAANSDTIKITANAGGNAAAGVEYAVYKETNLISATIPQAAASSVSAGGTTITTTLGSALQKSTNEIRVYYLDGVTGTPNPSMESGWTMSESFPAAAGSDYFVAGYRPNGTDLSHTMSGASGSGDALHQALVEVSTGSGTVQTLTGTCSGTGAASGALSANRGLAGTTSGTGASTASSLYVDRGLSAAASGAGHASAALGVDRALLGTSSGAGAAAAPLAVDRGLAGTASGAGDATAAAAVTCALVGAGHGTGAASGSLALDAALAGTADGAGDAAGDLVVAYALEGEVSGAGAAVGELSTGTIQELDGTCSGSGSAAGILVRQRLLSGACEGDGAAAAEIVPVRGLAGAAGGAGAASAALAVDWRLAGTASGLGSAMASAEILRGLVGQAEARGGAGGVLVVDVALSGEAIGVGELTGSIAAGKPLPRVTGTIAEVPGPAARLSPASAYAATLEAVGLTATMEPVGLVATLTPAPAFSATIEEE